MLSLQMKTVSSLEKCFLDEALETKREKKSFVMFANEKLSFQVMYRAEVIDEGIASYSGDLKTGGALAPYAAVRMVANVPNQFPTYNVSPGGEFLRTEPGLYPDLIRPLVYPGRIPLPHSQTHALWVDIQLPEDFAAGTYDFTLSLNDRSGPMASVTAEVTVLSAKLPAQTFIHTEWFYTDCIANYYHVRAFSKQHWKHIEGYMRTAVENGINMIMTPVFTPELDTYVGGERLTTQLVDIELTADGTYAFEFSKLHQWIDLALDCGVQYFEIPHFFTQWGAKAAPKIVVKVNGRRQKYFGWHTESTGEKYKNFLAQFIPALVGEFRKRGLDHKCYYHISDEPNIKALDHYRACKEMVAPYLEGYPIIDALSELEFYTSGAIAKPAPNTRSAHKFHEAGIPGLWAYYCGGGRAGVSDRSISMPAHRTRMLGVQLYYYNIEGFLHWGYNFYNSRFSHTVLDPYGNTEGCYFSPAGDAFLVYPGSDGTAWPSIRLNALREAMDDIRALQLYEAKFGREAAESLILEGTDGTFTFTHYPTDPLYLPNLREKIAAAFAEA